MFSMPSAVFVAALLAFSPASAGVLRRPELHDNGIAVPVSPRNGALTSSFLPFEGEQIFGLQRRADLVHQASTNLDVEALLHKVTRMQKAFAKFHGQLSLFLHSLKSTLKAASDSGSGSGSGTGSPKPTKSSPKPSTPSSYPSLGTFDPTASNNIVVYYGQTPPTTDTNLLDLCSDPAVTIVNLAFLPTYFGPDGFPSTSFGPACQAAQTSAQASKAPGLQNCAELGTQITQCQAQGKIVLVSLGGYIASSAFPSAASARKFASTIWNLFGPGTGGDAQLRPFGADVVVDGFDIDNEDHSTTYYTDFATALKKHYASPSATASGKRYYLSSTPQCPRPDASIPLDVMRMSDFVNVQFYNNPACDLDAGEGFVDSFEAWSSDLAGSPAGTRLLIGAPAWPGAGSGYVHGRQLKSIVAKAKAAAASYANFGGIAMWDGVEGLANVAPNGETFIDFAAAALA